MERKTVNTQPITGNMVGSNDTITNLVTLLGGTQPISDTQWEVRNYEPWSGLIIGPDSKAYSLPEMLGTIAANAMAGNMTMIDLNMTAERTKNCDLFDQVLDAWERHVVPIIRTRGQDCNSYYMPSCVTLFTVEGEPRKFSIMLHSPNYDVETWAIEDDTSFAGMDVHEVVDRKKIREGTAPEAAAFAPVYSETSAYSIGNLVWHDGLYKCKTAITSGEAWTAAHWQQTTIADEFTRKTT
ncbi:MAG: hypothetical protein Q4G19_02790 [Clostridia bacterium]|nr:hypothetical protein [Clostridia bacterium]